MKRFTRCAVILFAVFTSQQALSQYINSPYSGNGIGDLAYVGLPGNFSMGEVGIGTPSNWHINSQNPALLVYNLFSTFQLGLNSDFRTFNKVDATEQSASLGLRSMAMSFPVLSKARWVSSFTLLPYSNVKYNTFAADSVQNALATTQFQGDGGITEFAWSNGFTIYKNLSVGFKASYLFGEISEASIVKFESSETLFNYSITYEERSTYSDINLSMGLAYRQPLGDAKWLNIGGIYQLGSDISGKEKTLYRRVGSATELTSGSLTFDVPAKIGLGVSFEKVNNFKVGVDFETQNWNNSTSEGPGESFKRQSKLAVGGEFIPDYQSINNYLKRTTYRAGFNFTESPYVLNNEKINDFGINFGASFPMSGLSSLDAGFKVGVRGTTKNDLIRENYFQVVLGATINDRWFIKRRYD